MINNKKGAIELSVTTIVVVVIGITLLVLGIAWISNLFERLGLTTGSAFEKADAQLESLLGGGGSDQNPFRISPTAITLKSGDSSRAYAIFSNFYEQSFTGVSIEVTTVDSDKIVCRAQDNTVNTFSNSYEVPIKNVLKIPIYIKALESSPIGDATCLVKVKTGNFNLHIPANANDFIAVAITK